MLVSTVLSGAVSAILGAAALHYWTNLDQRFKLMKGMHSELSENRSRVKGQITEIEKADSWNGTLSIRYHTDVFRSVRLSNPSLYANISDDPGLILIAYRSLGWWDNWVEASQYPGANLNLSEEEMLSELGELLDEIDEACDEIHSFWEESWIARFHPKMELGEK